MSVAQTILEQLGGNKFAMMTGAKNFAGTPDSLSFRLPGGGGFCKDGINWVLIKLTPADTYTVMFYKSRARVAPKLISSHEDIYFDSLREVFERATGLRTSMGKVIFKGAEMKYTEEQIRATEAQAAMWRIQCYLDHMLQRQRNDGRRRDYIDAVKLVRTARERMEK